jgi:hypothetical protein
LTPEVDAPRTPVSTSCSGICWIVLRKKCCIKISITNAQ